ncbi:phosphate/phosphite/phosphonate ABC transporter substrate-binding protein [Paenibacillus piri]|uniref:Phosphate/phosphite/phosphonate ABC transporter substrate-binding protein n=2 Tax=Paenibacillus piri TaxID=2547395 RepID=A0A4R5L022_9BACL|nr:phosphate/phosphite/phosphonate ABC transporter substrate-binding protein [Paenibacillus piri]
MFSRKKPLPSWKGSTAFVLAMLLALITGCGTAPASGSGNNMAQGAAPAAPGTAVKNEKAGAWPEVLRIGVLPGEEEGKLSRGNKKFAEDLGKAVGIKTELFVGDDYTAVVEAMRTKKIDIASYGPFSYVIAAERSGAVPFAVKAKSQKDAFYYSLIVVPASSKAQSLADLKGKSFLFADPASTSGHLFPRGSLIKTLGITNDQVEGFFSNVSFSGGHDKSILAIAKGTADGAGVCDTCIQRVVDAGLVKDSDYRVLAKSDPIPSGPMTYRKDLPADLVEKVKQFMFNYHKENPDYFSNGTQAFYPIEDKDYQIVKDTAKALNMSPDELLKK